MAKSLAELYPKYYKAVPAGVNPAEVDTYVINMMFPVDDDSGCVVHARKKLLIPGVRSGGKTLLKDVIEARDTLNRFIALHEPVEAPSEQAVDGTVVDDGWITHNGNDIPILLDDDDLVEARMASGVEYVGNFAKKAVDWVWVNDGMHTRITHYRLAKIVQVVDPSPNDWKDHTNIYMPDGLDRHELVEIKLSNGHEVVIAKRADQWDWAYRQPPGSDAPHIAAWRRYRHQPC